MHYNILHTITWHANIITCNLHKRNTKRKKQKEKKIQSSSLKGEKFNVNLHKHTHKTQTFKHAKGKMQKATKKKRVTKTKIS